MPDKPDENIADIVIHTVLNDGMPVCIRTVNADDEARMRDGIAQMSERSRYLRFFSGFVTPPDRVIDSLLDVDGDMHIAWGAILTDHPEKLAIGAVHAIRSGQDDDHAEFSVAVLDDYQGLGLSRLLTATLLINCRLAGMETLDVQTLSENRAAISLVKSLGGQRSGTQSVTSDFQLDIKTAIAALHDEKDTPGLARVLAAFGNFD